MVLRRSLDLPGVGDDVSYEGAEYVRSPAEIEPESYAFRRRLGEGSKAERTTPPPKATASRVPGCSRNWVRQSTADLTLSCNSPTLSRSSLRVSAICRSI